MKHDYIKTSVGVVLTYLNNSPKPASFSGVHPGIRFCGKPPELDFSPYEPTAVQ
jgi:hypothetical protein